MNLKKLVAGFFVAALIFTNNLPISHAAEIKQGMSQGDFALALVERIGALPHLPPAATADDAIRFLTKLGLIPCSGGESNCGWDSAEPIDAAFLAKLLGLSEEEAREALSDADAFDKLLDRVVDSVSSSFNNLNTGVNAGGAPASGSGVA